jgi:hypothetical protein
MSAISGERSKLSGLKNAELKVAKDEAEGKHSETQTLSLLFSMSNFSELLFFLTYSAGETIRRHD